MPTAFISSKLFRWSITVALGGFLFGFDTAVISGAEQSIQSLWSLSDIAHGFTVSIALFGTIVGAIFGGIPADRFGRKRTLSWIGLLYLLSALGSALAPEWYSFLLFRFIGGLGVGASSVTAPMYISEIAPANQRGRLVAMFQFNIVLGILLAYASNYLIGTDATNAWRWMLGVEALPALAFVLLVLGVPHSPRWLATKRGDPAGARAVFERIDPSTAEEKLAAVLNEGQGETREQLFTSKYRFPIMLAFLFAFFNQLSGINALIYYAPRIFQSAGLAESSALLSTVGVGVVNLLFTLLGLALIDRFGRRTLMLLGSIGLILTLGLTSRSFFSGEPGMEVPYFLFGFIAFFALSQGAVIWVFISEIFPNSVRAAGNALGSSTHWLLAWLVSLVFPYFANEVGEGKIFLFFSIMMVLQLIYVIALMPETKGKSLEKLGETLTK